MPRYDAKPNFRFRHRTQPTFSHAETIAYLQKKHEALPPPPPPCAVEGCNRGSMKATGLCFEHSKRQESNR